MSVWEEIKARLSVEEVIADYVQVQNVGSNFRCRCPFHNDKTPSLIISPDKGIWHCFGCGAGGDIFKFVVDFENITKQEALKKLAQKAGVTLENSSDVPVKTKQEVTRFELGLKYLNWSAGLYHQLLLKILKDRQHPITQYCLERGLDQDTILKFQIGYAPKNGLLLQLANKHRLNLTLLQEVGLLKQFGLDAEKTNEKQEDIIRSKNNFNGTNSFRDKFTDRLMIPVFDRVGKVIGFTGRILPYDKTERPKYLNSPQSEWFSKSDIWFGWHLARSTILKEKKALIVEGNMDVISAFRSGLNYTLASQGTSFTTDQLKSLRTITKTIHLAFDNDEAGKLAAKKFFKSATQMGFEVYRVLIEANYKDLDEMLSDMHAKSQAVKLEVMPFVDFQLQSLGSDLISKNMQTQKEAITELVELVAALDPLTQELYLKKISELSGVSVGTLQSLALSQTTVRPLESVSQIQQDQKADEKQGNQNLVTWQRLAALSRQLPASKTTTNLKNMFVLLQNFMPELDSFATLEDYLTENGELLDFVFNQELEQKDEIYQNQLFQALMTYADRHVNQILLQDDLKDVYLKLKKVEH